MNMEQLIEQAITTHQVWTERFEADLAHGALPENFQETACDDLCDLGK